MLNHEEILFNSEQNSKLKTTLRYVKKNVPIYSKLLESIDLEKDFDDKELKKIYNSLPFQSKSSMRYDEGYFSVDKNILSSSIEKKYTGGTTGEPWCIHKTKTEIGKYFYPLWKSRLQFGIKPSDHFYQFGGYGEIDGVFTTKQIIEYNNYTEFSLFHLNDEVFDKYINVLQEGKGNWFFANPSALYLLALRMKEKGIKGIGKIKYIELTGERVYEYQEELFREVFDCPISVMYGSREVTTISHRCLYGNHHVFDHLIIETIDDNGKTIPLGTPVAGEIVATSLIDKYMPFIKYKTNDYAILSYKDDCPCGKKGLVFENILGRTAEIVEINNKKYHMELVFYLMDKFNSLYKSGIRQFQVTFRKPNTFIFCFVVENKELENIVSEFYKNELRCMIPGINVETKFKKIINRKKRKYNPYIIE